ncbi:hypothetical protein OPV22_009514 [Ensete ventricosum]|uniref:Uncharacterized protein n=1 Tax=Ensete ventricosum TaxID=4639 RepID=A0AAV8RJ99_ENSVE|nr:hypothetical protein OPV22_009514 [Ensete ventricosum]
MDDGLPLARSLCYRPCGRRNWSLPVGDACDREHQIMTCAFGNGRSPFYQSKRRLSIPAIAAGWIFDLVKG